jgi:hypothetical protein
MKLARPVTFAQQVAKIGFLAQDSAPDLLFSARQ